MAAIFIAPGDVISILGIEPGMTVAHLGCGATGYFALPIARRVGAEGKVYALDIMQSALASTRKHAELEGADAVIETVWSDLEVVGAAKILERSLDRALLINVLYQVKDVQAVMRESARLLKPGGLALVADWKAGDFPFGPKADHRVAPETVVAAAKVAGLIVMKKQDVGKYHYGMVLEKR